MLLAIASMIKAVVVLISLGVFALTVAAPSAPITTEFFNQNSRVPGDELIWQSSWLIHDFDFYGDITYDIAYPQDGSRSPYIITHIHIDAKETSGLMDPSIYGGCGTDFMRLRLKSRSVKFGQYQVLVYGKKK